MWLVVGLGNPGKQYASHRHNVGFMVVEEVAKRLRADSFREKFSAQYAKASHAGEDVVLLQPQTFMNVSGESVQPASAFFKVDAAHLIVIHDELDIPFKEVRLKQSGGHAGHNGLRSIIKHMGSPDFIRVRVGIGRPPSTFRGEVADWVLSPFDSSERAELPEIIERATNSVLDVLANGVVAATKKLHTSVPERSTARKQSLPSATDSKQEPNPRSGAEATGAVSPRGIKE